jgi:hypothetical protein
MRRREFFTLLGGAAFAWPLAGGAQEPSKLYRLGYLSSAQVPIPGAIEAPQTELRELGYIEGKNLKVEYRFGGHDLETLASCSRFALLRHTQRGSATSPVHVARKSSARRGSGTSALTSW